VRELIFSPLSFERGKYQKPNHGECYMKLVRVVSPYFVAGFESDGIIRRAAPIIKYMIGWDEDKARKYIAKKGWTASVITEK
jgi:hypothetical protein